MVCVCLEFKRDWCDRVDGGYGSIGYGFISCKKVLPIGYRFGTVQEEVVIYLCGCAVVFVCLEEGASVVC